MIQAGMYLIVNRAAFQEELFVSAMFEHEKGAFTGAHEARLGKLEMADRGTLIRIAASANAHLSIF